MSIHKLTILLRSSSVLWTYKESCSSDFWDDIVSRVTAGVKPAAPVQDNKSSFMRVFYIASEREADYFSELANGIMSELLPQSIDRSSIVISVSTPDADDLSKLREKTGTSAENMSFWKEADKIISQAAKSVPEEKPAETPIEKARAIIPPVLKIAPPETDEPAAQKKSEPSEPSDGPVELSGQAKKIRALKEGLLARIRGQRHAVDEMVQSIFECEMFASRNPKRKGPLATFLFTGPSGVGKTYLAEQCGELLGRPMLVVDMSEYSDNLANNKFNGDHGQPAVVTGFVRNNPSGIIVFDEVEKAHINTIHLFLQILDAGRLMDHQIKKEVSFRDNIIIMTTNAGKSLYDDSSVCDLSGTPRSVILDALRTDKNTQTGEPYFPECITTRMANGHVILFNHLEPFSLMEIVGDEIALQMSLFEQSSGIKVEYDARTLAALVLYNGGGVADARTLRGLARNIIVRELQEIVMQLFACGEDRVNSLRKITLSVDTCADESVGSLFVSRDEMYVAVFAENVAQSFSNESRRHNTVFEVLTDSDLFKRRIRGVTDYVLIDPLCGAADSERVPNDIEDIDSEGMRMFEYLREYCPDTPMYILDTSRDGAASFDTLLARGAKGIIRLNKDDTSEFGSTLEQLSFNALINNGVFSLGRSGKFLAFNCAQYLVDNESAVVSFEKLQLRSAPLAGDNGMIARKGENNNLKFADIVGCKAAKETLGDYCKALDNPRQTAIDGKRMPKGVLLYGPPGTGKTMLAKAMANECNATFFPVSATSFFGSLVGETERNIREIFRKARKYAPSIIFVDEVDAIGRRRIGSPSTSHNEDALNTFLAEMDGFVTDEKRPVFILAATNYELEGDGGRVLDPAFVRRFDSKVLIPLPDTDARYEFLVKCLAKHGIHFGENHEKILHNMAERTGGMSNADLDMMNAQFVRAVGDGEPDAAKYMDTLDAFRFGEVNKMDPEHLRQTACHEAGHALVCRLCGTTPSFLTIVSRGSYGGFMESAGEKTGTYTFQQLMDLVCRCLAGRAAEIELYGESKGINTGASSDIKKARYYVKACLGDFAMGEQLFTRWRSAEAETLIQAQYERTRTMLHEHRQALERLTDLLTEKKSLNQTEMEDFFASEDI